MNPYSANKCKNCIHHSEAESQESCCGIGANRNSGKPCYAFAPANSEIAYDHASNIVNSTRYKVTLINFIKAATVAVAVGIIALLVAEWDSDSMSFIWIMAAIGLFCLVAGGILYWVYHVRRKNMAYDLQQKLNAPLTAEYIFKALGERHMNPEFRDGTQDMAFVSHRQTYLLRYDGVTVFLLHRTMTDDSCESLLLDASLKINQSILTTKVFVSTRDDGMVAVDSLCNAHVNTCKAFDDTFWEYFYDLECTVNRVFDSIDYAQNQSASNNSRSEIYQPEFRLFPSIVKMVSTGQILIEALTDEAWIRDIVQSKCPNEGIRAEWDNFKIKRVDNYGDYKLIIYEFPEPKFAPEAKYAAVVVNTSTLEADYYTLEMSDNDLWFYCGATEDEHLNYGEAEYNDLDHFIEWVLGQNKVVAAKADWSKATVSTPKNVN